MIYNMRRRKKLYALEIKNAFFLGSDKGYVEFGGDKYPPLNGPESYSLRVEPDTAITVTVGDYDATSYIYFNGSEVARARKTKSAKYVFNLTANAKIVCKQNPSEIYITMPL